MSRQPGTEYPITGGYLAPNAIANGPDGNLWFSGLNLNKIGQITPKGVITETDLSSSGASPGAIAFGSDGNCWFVDASGKIGRLTANGTVTEFTSPSANGSALGIVAGAGWAQGGR